MGGRVRMCRVEASFEIVQSQQGGRDIKTS